MTVYFIEMGFCFQPRPTAFTLENNACLSLDQASQSTLVAAWTDGTWWMDFDGTLVGWIEIDGVTYFPPLASYPVAQELAA